MSKNIELKKWVPAFADGLAELANNKKIADNLRNAFPFPYTKNDAREYVHAMMNANESKVLARAIVAGGEVVGSIGIFRRDDIYEKSAELGYWLGEPFWGKGILTYCIGEMCALAFGEWDIVRIYAEPFADNAASRRVLEKNGFCLEGTMKNGAHKNGKIIDWCMYAKYKEG